MGVSGFEVLGSQTEMMFSSWAEAMASGEIGGKPFSPVTIGLYKSYMRKHLDAYGCFSSQNLREAIFSIPIAQFGKREKLYRVGVCFLKYLFEQDDTLAEEEKEKILQKIRKFRPKSNTPPKRMTVAEDSLQKLLQACSNIKETLLVTLLSATGLRASEACALRFQDINLKDGFLTVQKGKGGKRRRVGLTAPLVEAYEAYCLSQALAVEPMDFIFKNTAGCVLNSSNLYQLLRAIGKRAGVSVSPHALRRAFVTININKGRPLVHLQIACGHSSITTTRDYCQTTEDEVIRSMKDW